MFADDTNITVSDKSTEEAEVAVYADLNNTREWLLSNRLCLNLIKTEYLFIGSRYNINTLEVQPRVFIGDDGSLKGFRPQKPLVSKLTNSLLYFEKISSGIRGMKQIKDFTDSDTLMSI
jgi:hypothetical protein